MKKNYITHDIGARNDPKLLKLQMEMGGHGLAIYWCLVEMLWENEGYLPLESKTIAFALHWCQPDEVQAVIFNYNLFENDGERFWSPGALDRIDEMRQNFLEAEQKREEASMRGKNAIRARWDKVRNAEQNAQANTDVDTDVIRENNGRNTLTNYTNYTNYTNNSSFGRSPEEKQKRFLEIFFFDLNLTDPAREVQRFTDYYDGNGWTLGKGRKISDPEAVARQWTPEDGKKNRLPKAFLEWFKMIYASAGEDPGLQMSILSDLVTGEKKSDNEISMTFRTREIAIELRDLIKEHFGDKFIIDWRLRNG